VEKTTIVFFECLMNDATAAVSRTAHGRDTRLAIFRLLVRAGDDGLNIGEIGQYLDMATSTLAYHLETLVGAGLVVRKRQGRQIMKRLNFDAMHRTVSFLAAEYRGGSVCLNRFRGFRKWIPDSVTLPSIPASVD
jgi:DNA-binding transcriptional ArsR family regulator